MQEELRSVLDLINAEEDPMLEIKTTPDVYITQKSTPHEVKQWLKDKDFSQRYVMHFPVKLSTLYDILEHFSIISRVSLAKGTQVKI